jgi:hypothetical protein
MKILTNANQLKIIKSVSTPTISKTLDDQTNDATYLSNGHCPRGICDAGWTLHTCSKGK